MSRQYNYQIKRIENGICSICGTKPLFSASRCKSCYQKDANRRGVVHYGKNIELRAKRKEIIQETRTKLKNQALQQKNVVYAAITKKYNISITTLRNLLNNNRDTEHKSKRKPGASTA